MTEGVEVRLDGSTLVVRFPMRFQRRGGRKCIVAPDGSAIVPTSKPQPDGALLKALARAWRWQRMLDDCVYASVSDIGNAENISKSYVSRILRLALLAPDIVEGILAGAADQRWCWRGWSGHCRWTGVSRAPFFRHDIRFLPGFSVLSRGTRRLPGVVRGADRMLGRSGIRRDAGCKHARFHSPGWSGYPPARRCGRPLAQRGT
jgi:hypothetical protein